MPFGCVLVLVLSLYLIGRDYGVFGGKYHWMKYDNFDRVDKHFTSVNGNNCKSKQKDYLVFPKETVAQRPVFNRLSTGDWYANRTSMIHLHNMALNRAFFFSYILQKMNDTHNFNVMPNWLYMYMSVAADVNANPYGINGSSIIFDTNCSYPNWYTTVPFNKTLTRFAPKAWRWDDYSDQDNFLREPTRQVAKVADIGAGRDSDYTHPGFKMNPWYEQWLPDLTGDMDSLTKFTYNVGIKYSNESGKFTRNQFQNYHFFGPSSPGQTTRDEKMLPVLWTQPYYDCGQANKWIVSAIAPVVDYMPRYTNWTHLRRQRFVAVISMDIDLNKLDFNACPVGTGNPGPSYLSGTDRCKEKTTMCKHKSGFGFKRGGYECICKPGYRYPTWIEPPFQGKDLEQATVEEYEEGFECTGTDFQQVLPVVDNLESVSLEEDSITQTGGGVDSGQSTSKLTSNFRSRRLRSINESYDSSTNYEHFIQPQTITENLATKDHLGVDSIRYIYPQPEHLTIRKLTPKQVLKIRKGLQNGHRKYISRRTMTELREYWKDNFNNTKRRRKRAAAFDPKSVDKMFRIFRHIASVTPENCHSKLNAYLSLSGDVGYGVEKQFEMEGRTALRLAHFISNYLQNTNPNENFGNLKGGGHLHIEHLMGEVVANVMGNYKIRSSGIYFDRNVFTNIDGSVREMFGPLAYRNKKGLVNVIDTAGLDDSYLHEDWYTSTKSRWGTNTVGLKTYKMRTYLRSDPQGTSSVRHEYFPLSYIAPAYTDGMWLKPTFKCDGRVDDWVMSYVVPFFSYDSLRRQLLFKGVISVDVPLDLLEINQCPQNFYVSNAFKNTARCHHLTTKCLPTAGLKFTQASYRCICREGHEYPHMDGKQWIDGSILELEWKKKTRGLFNRFDWLKCRVSAASMVSQNSIMFLVSVLLTIHWRMTDT